MEKLYTPKKDLYTIYHYRDGHIEITSSSVPRDNIYQPIYIMDTALSMVGRRMANPFSSYDTPSIPEPIVGFKSNIFS